ncbi:beta family protein [Paenibacillus donghaensis]|nr:hypothetical protein [Paenibacillus donghaensis]
MTYYPILKISNAEMGALEHLKEETIDWITPILESKIIAKDKIEQWWTTFRTLGKYLRGKIGEMTFIYDFSSAFEKIGEIRQLKDQNGFDLVQHCIMAMEEAQLNFIPCVHFDSPEWFINSVLTSNSEVIAVRIRCHAFNSPMEEIVQKRILEEIIGLNNEKKYILILDFYNSPISLTRMETSIKVFSSLPFQRIVFALTSCPEDANKAAPNSFTLICQREDLKTFRKLQEGYPYIEYGDYTVRLKPEFEGNDINYYNTYLKLFYTTEDDYYIAKSSILEKNGVESFIAICQEIIESDVYSGADFSYGDWAIKECAEKKLIISNHPKPIEFGINHHIELTARLL